MYYNTHGMPYGPEIPSVTQAIKPIKSYVPALLLSTDALAQASTKSVVEGARTEPWGRVQAGTLVKGRPLSDTHGLGSKSGKSCSGVTKPRVYRP
jgi:hypothetical protein